MISHVPRRRPPRSDLLVIIVGIIANAPQRELIAVPYPTGMPLQNQFGDIICSP